jgi:hypothetical protein
MAADVDGLKEGIIGLAMQPIKGEQKQISHLPVF